MTAVTGNRPPTTRCTERLASDSPRTAVRLNELGVIGKRRGAFREAEAMYARALAIYELHGQVASANGAALMHNLAGLAHARGDAAGAELLARRGILIRAGLAQPDPRALAEDRAALAAILIDLGRLGEAAGLLRQVLRAYRAAYGPVHYEIAATLHNIGSLQFRAGRPLPAAGTLKRSLDMKASVLGDSHPDLAITLHNLACCALQLGDPRQASRDLHRAVAILQPSADPGHPTLVSCRDKIQRAGDAVHPQPRKVEPARGNLAVALTVTAAIAVGLLGGTPPGREMLPSTAGGVVAAYDGNPHNHNQVLL
jgi:tetratricopeptide (TPR) repeat protein